MLITTTGTANRSCARASSVSTTRPSHDGAPPSSRAEYLKKKYARLRTTSTDT
jgi:hypothetical protein